MSARRVTWPPDGGAGSHPPTPTAAVGSAAAAATGGGGVSSATVPTALIFPGMAMGVSGWYWPPSGSQSNGNIGASPTPVMPRPPRPHRRPLLPRRVGLPVPAHRSQCRAPRNSTTRQSLCAGPRRDGRRRPPAGHRSVPLPQCGRRRAVPRGASRTSWSTAYFLSPNGHRTQSYGTSGTAPAAGQGPCPPPRRAPPRSRRHCCVRRRRSTPAAGSTAVRWLRRVR